MLMIKSLKFRVPEKHLKLWKIKLLVGLKKHYKNTGLKKGKKESQCSFERNVQGTTQEIRRKT